MKERLARRLAGVLEPVRDLAVGRLLQAMAEELEQGNRVRQEPARRAAAGHVLRNGGLHLPRRDDLSVTEDGRTVVRTVTSRGRLSFDPVRIESDEGFVAEVRPFRWDAAEISADIGDGALDVAPIRRWYLEAFQSRFSDLSPDLDGVVHALLGPRRVGRVYVFQCDFGSAPAETVVEMLVAFAQAGARGLKVGDEGSHKHALPA